MIVTLRVHMKASSYELWIPKVSPSRGMSEYHRGKSLVQSQRQSVILQEPARGWTIAFSSSSISGARARSAPVTYSVLRVTCTSRSRAKATRARRHRPDRRRPTSAEALPRASFRAPATTPMPWAWIPRNPKFKEEAGQSMLALHRPPSSVRAGGRTNANASLQASDRGPCCNNGVRSSHFSSCVARAAKTAIVRRCTHSALDTVAAKT